MRIPVVALRLGSRNAPRGWVVIGTPDAVMSRRIGALVATAAIAAIVNDVGVIHFFRPIATADSAAAPPVPAVVGFGIYVVLSVFLLDWASRQIGRPMKAALIIAASQMILVSIDFVLRGERGIATGAASAALILATWSMMGAVYGAVLPDMKSAGDRARTAG